MELRQLRYFLGVAELMSFSRAALALHIAQPALSRQISRLEEEVGAALFYRNGRGVLLTEPGKQYYEKVKSILRQLEQASAEAQAMRDTPSGEVALGVPPQLGAIFIAQIVQLFRARYPTARIRVAEGFSFQVAEWLQSAQVDLGFVYDPQAYHHLLVAMIVEEALYLVGPPACAATASPGVPFRSVIELPLVMPDLPSTLRQRVEAVAAQFGATVSFPIEVDSLPAIKQLIIDGAGYTILPYAAVYNETRQGLLSAARIVEPEMFRPLALAVPLKGGVSVATKKLIGLISEEIGELLSKGRWSGRIIGKGTGSSGAA